MARLGTPAGPAGPAAWLAARLAARMDVAVVEGVALMDMEAAMAEVA